MRKDQKPFIEWTFAQKRDEWMRQLAKVPEKEIPSGAKLVAFRLSLYMREKQRRAFPSYDALGEACGMSARMVQTHALLLHEKKWIEINRQRAKGNQYWLRYYNFQPSDIDLMEMDALDKGDDSETEA
jgi:hypothetical protein